MALPATISGTLVELPDLFETGTPDHEAARELSARTVDLMELLASRPLAAPEHGAGVDRVAYHDACHALRAQGIHRAPREVLAAVEMIDAVLGLGLLTLARADLRLRPKDAQVSETDIERALERRALARAEKDFETADGFRKLLAAQGVEVMDGDPLGWEWKL